MEGMGRDIRFAARDLAVIRTLEAGRVNTERADTELLTAISEALYFRRAPDGTLAPGAPIYWAARALLHCPARWRQARVESNGPRLCTTAGCTEGFRDHCAFLDSAGASVRADLAAFQP